MLKINAVSNFDIIKAVWKLVSKFCKASCAVDAVASQFVISGCQV
jgi:hypothetical protein